MPSALASAAETIYFFFFPRPPLRGDLNGAVNAVRSSKSAGNVGRPKGSYTKRATVSSGKQKQPTGKAGKGKKSNSTDKKAKPKQAQGSKKRPSGQKAPSRPDSAVSGGGDHIGGNASQRCHGSSSDGEARQRWGGGGAGDNGEENEGGGEEEEREEEEDEDEENEEEEVDIYAGFGTPGRNVWRDDGGGLPAPGVRWVAHLLLLYVGVFALRTPIGRSCRWDRR